MTKISRYFLAAFLRPFFFSYGALMTLMLAAQLMERLDKFIAESAGLWQIVGYLGAVIPTRSLEIFPVATLLASLFSLGNLSDRQEITAVVSGGIHPWRCAKPLLAVGILLTGLSWTLSEWVVPFSNRRAKRIYNQDIRRLTFEKPTSFTQVVAEGRNVFYFIDLLDTEAARMENVVVDERKEGKPVAQIQGETATWKDGAWTFHNGMERRFGNDGLTLSHQIPFQKKTIALSETPHDLAPANIDPEELSHRSLKKHIQKMQRLGIPSHRQEVDLHMKQAFPWANMIVLLLGIPFAFQKGGSKVKAIGFSLGVAFLYFGLMQVGRALGQKPWFPPVLGAWLANLIFLGLGAKLFLKMRRLS
jgi:lipopolysaccharide export system permease protein